jgi:hypothetical protein
VLSSCINKNCNLQTKVAVVFEVMLKKEIYLIFFVSLSRCGDVLKAIFEPTINMDINTLTSYLLDLPQPTESSHVMCTLVTH